MGERRQPESRRRAEPSLGNLDQVQGDTPARSPAPASAKTTPSAAPSVPGEKRARPGKPPVKPGRRWKWLLLAAIVVILASLVLIFHKPLRSRFMAYFPRTQLNTLLVRADKALAEGHLEGNDGNSARELYGAVRALEPDNEHAIEGLRKVGNAELERARKAIAAHDYATAQSSLEDARSLLGGGDAVHAVAQQLIQARQSQAQTAALIAQARKALAQGQLDGAEGAAALYRQALQAEPDNAVARHGLDKVGDALASQARTALGNGKLDQADDLIGQIASLMPTYGDLPALRAALSQARQKNQAAVEDHLQKADDALRAGKVSGPGDDNALAQYQAALQVDPGNVKAKAGLGQVAQALLLRASASIDAADYNDASQLIDQAAKLAPHSADLAAVRSRLQAVQAQAAQAAAAHLNPQQKARVASLLARAQAALKAGDILTPPGASAYDLYSEVLNIDGSNPDALHGLQGLAGHATTRFNRALNAGDLPEAGKMLDVLGQLVPGDASQQALRRRLADAWLDRAEKSLGAGDREAARQALDAASKLRPDAPRVQSLRTRINGNS